MKRFLQLFAAVVVALPLYAQDCPELSCVDGLTITLYPDSTGGCSISADPFDLISSDMSLCPPPLEAAVYRRQEVVAAGDQFTPDFQERDTLSLNENDDETTIVDVYFRDGSGMIQHCETYLLIQGITGIDCGYVEPPYLNGAISTLAGDAVSQVDVTFSGDIEALYTTSEDGSYGIYNLVVGGNYTITPQRNDNPLNGVSTFDIVLISKYILGTLPFDDPYRLIAADVNQSGSVTVLDAIHMRKLILGQYSTFPNSPSWRFVPADYTFPVPTNPWHEEFPTNTVFAPLTADVSGINFIGIKMGDVNGSALAN